MTYADLKALIEQRGVHPEFGDAGEGWNVEQNPHELATFLVAMQTLGVQSCLEIGTGYKGGLSRFLAAELGWQVTSVDVEDYGHTFAGVEYVILHDDIPYGYSEIIAPYFDLLFIDGNHGYDAVHTDYLSYVHYPTKAIAFHDIAGLRGCKGVTKYWEELCTVTSVHEIIDNSERKAGIGWLVL
jgi:hypothetical protein